MNLAEKMGAQVKIDCPWAAHGVRMDGLGRPGALAQRATRYAWRATCSTPICVTGEAVGDVMFYGRGAGSLPTASAVVGDVVQVLKHAAPVGESVTDGAAFDSAAEEGSFCALRGGGSLCVWIMSRVRKPPRALAKTRARFCA